MKDLTERAGILAVETAVNDELGWYSREPLRPDYGIDLFLEAADLGIPTGRMLAVQVKSGPSFFSEVTSDGVIFRGDQAHLAYWSRHSLPAIVVLHDPTSGISYWQTVNSHTVEETGVGWKLTVPYSQRLDASSRDSLAALAEGDPYTGRLQGLRADRAWMQALASGDRLFIEAEEWVNKSSGRGTMRLVLEPAAGGATVVRERSFLAPGWSYADLLPSMVPWGALSNDQPLYEEHDRSRWETATGIWGTDLGKYVDYFEEFDDWAGRNIEPGLRPYDDNGEVAFWRLEVTLSDLGSAFLTVDSHLDKP